MVDLPQRQCLNHPMREAVARCPACGHCYCRECIAEHEDRVLCAACLRKLLRPAAQTRGSARAWLAQGALLVGSFALSWLAFYLVGRLLLTIPVSVHDGTFWHNSYLSR